jgi:molybdate transport system ATP-binding protein
MTLRAQFQLTRGALSLDIDLAAARGETIALVGPNGAGKTSCLQAIAGLLPIARGAITWDGRTLDAGPREAFVPPEQRGVGFVFQEHLLFPHLSALDNVAFGLRARGAARADARRRAAAWLERVGLASVASARPTALSGGQAQRVALARALATEPRLLLLDEPLSAVDASTKLELRRDLRAHLASFAGVCLVTAHAAVDAFALAERIAVVEAGRIVQLGSAAEICSQPRSRYVADLVGVNCFLGTVRAGVLALPGAELVVGPSPREGPALATVHPRAIALYRERPDGSPRNVWRAPVLALEPALGCVRVQLGGAVPLVAEVTGEAARDLHLAAGSEVWIAVKATEISVHPA